MRVEFVNSIKELLKGDSSALFLTGDLGFMALEPIRDMLGNRFINMGVSEQNMMGVATGLATEGFRPWVYSIAPFVTYRCLEQIRNDVCMHNLPIRIVGNGGGYTYGIMGSTHHALEELAALKALPNMKLFFPAANDQVFTAVSLIHRLDGPSYLRLAISGYNTPDIEPISENPKTLTRQYVSGKAATLIGIGHGVHVILAALKKYSRAFPEIDVFSLARFPFDKEEDWQLFESVRKTGKILVVEEHYKAGSIGESLSLVLPRVKVFEILCPYYFREQLYGSSKFHLDQCGVTPEAVFEWLKNAIDD